MKLRDQQCLGWAPDGGNHSAGLRALGTGGPMSRERGGGALPYLDCQGLNEGGDNAELPVQL